MRRREREGGETPSERGERGYARSYIREGVEKL